MQPIFVPGTHAHTRIKALPGEMQELGVLWLAVHVVWPVHRKLCISIGLQTGKALLPQNGCMLHAGRYYMFFTQSTYISCELLRSLPMVGKDWSGIFGCPLLA